MAVQTRDSETIRILVVAGQAVVRRGLLGLLQTSCPDFGFDEAASPTEAMKIYSRRRVDLMLLDSGMLAAEDSEILQPKWGEPPPRVLVIAESDEHFWQALRLGACGCILRSVDGNELLHAVRLVISGYFVFSRTAAEFIAESCTRRSSTASASPAVRLTDREREVLGLIAQEYTNAEIASRLCISPRTVDAHRARLMQKLGTRNTAGLVRIAIEQGLLYRVQAG